MRTGTEIQEKIELCENKIAHYNKRLESIERYHGNTYYDMSKRIDSYLEHVQFYEDALIILKWTLGHKEEIDTIL